MRSARYGLTRDAATLDLADRNVRKALEIAPALPAGYVVRASIALNRGDYSQAIQDLQTAGRFDPENAEVQLTLAYAYAGSGKLELADRIYERLLEDRPNDWTPLNDWGSIYFRRANYPRAERCSGKRRLPRQGPGCHGAI
jgi:tetratricopeptide (TPR) repeat protein